MKDILGVGWAYPLQTDSRGRIALAHHETDIAQAIKIILGTPKGQRVMRPEFGCQIHELLFEPNDATTHGLAVYYVQEALNMWEPRIDVIDVNVQTDHSRESLLHIEISYVIKSTHAKRSLVFPFYTIPDDE